RIQKKLKSIHLSGNEFLKHFYLTSNSTNKEKIEKHKRMKEKLRSTLKKIDSLHKLRQETEDETSTPPPPNTSNTPRQHVSDDVWRESLKIAREMVNPLRISIMKALGLPLEQDQNGVKAIAQKISANRDMSQPVIVTSRDAKNDGSHQKVIARDNNKNSSDQRVRVPSIRDPKTNQSSQRAPPVRDATNDVGSRKLVRDSKTESQMPRTNGEIKQKRPDASRASLVSSSAGHVAQGQSNHQTTRSMGSRQHETAREVARSSYSSVNETPRASSNRVSNGSTKLTLTSNQESLKHASSTREAHKSSSSTRVTLNVNRDGPPSQAQRREQPQPQSTNRIILKGIKTAKTPSGSSSTQNSQTVSKAGVKRKR
ncbi:14828_t:CDS:2, partial [Acaulospora colombiana]